MNEQFYIWSMEHSAWWRPNHNGYTRELSEAGIYTRAECDAILRNANWMTRLTDAQPHEAMIPVSTLADDSKEQQEVIKDIIL